MFNFLKMGNKGQVHELPSFIIAVGVFTLVLALVGLILGEFQEIANADAGVNGTTIAGNISETGAEGMLTGAGFIPLLIIIGVVVVVLAMVMRLRGM